AILIFNIVFLIFALSSLLLKKRFVPVFLGIVKLTLLPLFLFAIFYSLIPLPSMFLTVTKFLLSPFSFTFYPLIISPTISWNGFIFSFTKLLMLYLSILTIGPTKPLMLTEQVVKNLYEKQL